MQFPAASIRIFLGWAYNLHGDGHSLPRRATGVKRVVAMVMVEQGGWSVTGPNGQAHLCDSDG